MEAFDFDDQESAKRHNHRRAPRIEKRLEIVLQFPEREQRYITRDISYVGVFVVPDCVLNPFKCTRNSQMTEGV